MQFLAAKAVDAPSENLNREFQNLMMETNRVAHMVTYNGFYLFSGVNDHFDIPITMVKNI